MKNLKILLYLFFTIFGNALHAQLSDITPEMLTTESYEKFPGAEAVILVNKGPLSIRSDRTSIFVLKKTVRLHILSEAGIKHADIVIPFVSKNNNQVIEDISAITYTLENGEIEKSKISSKDVFKEDISERLTLLNVYLSSSKTRFYT